MMHLEAIQARNAEACENAPLHKTVHIRNAHEWLRRSQSPNLPEGASVGRLMDAAADEYSLAGLRPGLPAQH